MRKALVIASGLLLFSLVAAPASAWGFVGHRLIMQRAIDLLPLELKPFFTANRDEIVVRAVDPDLWRVAGWEDDPNHFIDFGLPELGPYPFTALPREYGAAIEKFGMAGLKRIGMIPWREAEEFGNLRRAFEDIKRGGPFGTLDALFFSAVASHYIQDAYQPFHATNNFDGQLTGQSGLHSRFETELVERFQSRLAINPARPVAIANPRDATFDAVLASYKLVDPILAADKAAVGQKDIYDDEYFEKFFAAVGPILEQRLSEAATATASIIVGAWERAGKPVVPLKVTRPPLKVRK